jgi:hypothetical protein
MYEYPTWENIKIDLFLVNILFLYIVLLSFHGILIYDKNIKYKLYIIKNKRKN